MLTMRTKLALLSMTTLVSVSLADPVDWVNPNYVASRPGSTTSDARSTIMQGASSSAGDGPWTLTSANILPPSGNSKDYLSWAPYHWPDCNWCPAKSGKRRVGGNVWLRASQGPGQDDTQLNLAPDSRAGSGRRDNGLPDLPDIEVDGPDGIEVVFRGNTASTSVLEDASISPFDTASAATLLTASATSPLAVAAMSTLSAPVLESASLTLLTTPTSAPTSLPTSQSSTEEVYSPASSGENAQLYGTTSSTQCTPSPTRSLAASATWTTCPYKTKDGQANPDVRQLVGVNAIQALSQSVIYNTIAYTLSGSSKYGQAAASFIDAFFLNSRTGMNPNINFGQVIRGPGRQQGQFMGVLDFRGMIKIANGILLLRASKSKDWTPSRDTAMASWVKSYIQWIQKSDIGVAASKATNNHGTFYSAQLAALQVLVGDEVAARQTVKDFFTGTFRDQIAADGEQPWEAARKGRSFHYRCFNLEALFTIGKIADQLGVNAWLLKTKSGATIQDAVDFIMTVPPGSEDVTELAPHVAAASAVYGDPKGKYAKFLARTESNYKEQSYWYYDQPSAITFSTAVKPSRRGWIRRDEFETYDLGSIYPSCLTVDNATNSCIDPTPPTDVTEPNKPDVFYSVDLVQLDDAVFVSWDDLRQYY